MGVFDELLEIDDKGNFVLNKWIEWIHIFIPNKPEWLRKILRSIMAILMHCQDCTSLDGCYLVDSNKPKQPLHTNCDCNKKEISFIK